MTVGLAGEGPAAEAVESALGDVDERVERAAPADLGADHRLAVVVDRAGAPAFERANERALATDLPWLAVELGGIGGYPVVDAAVTGFEPEGACFACLSTRVESNVAANAEPVSPPGDATARFAGAVAGRRLAGVLDPAESDSLGTVVELPHAEREFLPVPGCACGEGAVGSGNSGLGGMGNEGGERE